MYQSGFDFTEGYQDEIAIVHLRVGKYQCIACDDAIAVEQQVEIEGARPPVDTALPQIVVFDVEHGGEKFLGREQGIYGADGVEKVWLRDRSQGGVS